MEDVINFFLGMKYCFKTKHKYVFIPIQWIQINTDITVNLTLQFKASDKISHKSSLNIPR